MRICTRPPVHPYTNLAVAALFGIPAGCLVVSLCLAMFAASSLQESFTRLADAVAGSIFGYFFAMPCCWVPWFFLTTSLSTGVVYVRLAYGRPVGKPCA